MSDEISDTSSKQEPYAASTPLTWLFGSGPEVKILSVFLSEGDRTIKTRDVASMAGVEYEETKNILQKLSSHGLVILEENVDDSQNCRANKNSEVMKNLAQLEIALLERWHHDQKST
jgi:DNA-directed RNA polymerase specialized sigma subunit